MSESVESVSKPEVPKRIHRSVEEKRRIVEATFAQGTSIARVAREHGVNSNQVFQWRYEYRKGILGGRPKPEAKLLPVVVTEPEPVAHSEVAAICAGSGGSIHVELPSGVCVRIESNVDRQLVRTVLESLRP